MAEQALNQNVIANRKYIGPNKTGDNIDADRNANYVWDGASWQRMTQATVGPNGGQYTTSVPLATRLDSATTTNVTYVGKAAIATATSAASWQIMKIDETTANTLIITWAAGTSSFNQVWDNRASLVYS